MKSDLAKVLHPVCGRPMLSYVVDAVESAGSLKNYVVLGHQFEDVKQILPKSCIAIKQKLLRGTADAVKSVKNQLKAYDGDVLVVCGDTPLLTGATLKALVKYHKNTGASCTILTAVIPDSSGYGRIIRGMGGDPVAIREEKDATSAEKNILEINVGVYCFKAGSLFKALSEVRENKRKKEFYLTDVVEVMADKRWKIGAVEIGDPQEALGVNSKVELAIAEREIRYRILEDLMLKGVTIIDPNTTYIAANATIGADTVIKPFTVIEENVRIGKQCVIGPFAHCRLNTRIGDHTEIGNYTEVSRSTIGKDCFMKHFSFIGDAKVGDRVNIGAGTVTANFDGKDKHKTVIKNDAFIGSNTTLVAPAMVGQRAVVGAGCVVVKDKNVPNGCVMVGVPGRVIGKKKINKK